MILKSIIKTSMFYILLAIAFPHQITNEVDIPELRFLSSQLKYNECLKIVAFNFNPRQSKEQMKKLTKEQECFQRLVKWICQLRTLTRNTYPILKDRLKDVGRKDLIIRLAEFHMETSLFPKVVRDVQSVDDSDDYEGMSTETNKNENEVNSEQDKSTNDKTKTSLNHTDKKANEYASVRISLKAAGFVLIVTVLLTCCCTLFIRNKLMNLCNKLRGKKKRSKFIPVDSEDERRISRSLPLRKSHKKRKRAPSYEMVHTATQNTVPVVPREPEELEPTGCYKCYKKKRKKSRKRPKR